MKHISFCLFFLSLFFVGCFNKTKQGDSVVEDVKAKELFQGLWVSDDNGEPALLAKGDSVFFQILVAYLYAFGYIKILFT